ncbi:MAG: hypothetical protein Ta2B_00760 [Termitinemataceae bacterium]|nr:MAG: hypothetical protein Ta2B_00760 [Termitinemataceae bacterium]
MIKALFAKIFIVSFLIFSIFIAILKIQTNIIGGDAISGYHSDNRYFIMTNTGHTETSWFLWYSNKILWTIVLILGVVSGIGVLFFLTFYLFPVVLKNLPF